MTKHYRNMALWALWLYSKTLKRYFRNIGDCQKAIDTFGPDVVILIDYPSFNNLRIAQYVKENYKHLFIIISHPKYGHGRNTESKDKTLHRQDIHYFPFETEF